MICTHIHLKLFQEALTLPSQMLADELETKYSKQKEAASELHVPMLGSGPSARVRQIAQAALRLSDEDIDDLFCDTLHTHSQVHIIIKVQCANCAMICQNTLPISL